MLTALFMIPAAYAQKNISLKSPDGNIVFSFKLTPQKPLYKVQYKGKELIGDSELGFSFKEQGAFGAKLLTPKAVYSQTDEQYELVIGKASKVRNHYKQVLIPLMESKGRQINLIVRAFNDGLAFRYEFPKQQNWSSYTMTAENSGFNISGDPGVRTLIFDTYNNNHENLYQKMPLSELKENKLMDLPAFVRVSGKNLYGRYRSQPQGLCRDVPD